MAELARANGEDLAAELPPAELPLDKPDDFYVVNMGQLSDVVGVSQTTLRNFIRKYADFPILNRGAHGVPYEFDVRPVKAWLDQHAAEAEAGKVAEGERVAQLRLDWFGEDFQDDPVARRLSPREEGELIDARLKTLKLSREHRTILVRADVERVLGLAFTALRDDVLGLADHLARELSLARKDRNAVDTLLEASLKRLAGKIADPALYGNEAGFTLNG